MKRLVLVLCSVLTGCGLIYNFDDYTDLFGDVDGGPDAGHGGAGGRMSSSSRGGSNTDSSSTSSSMMGASSSNGTGGAGGMMCQTKTCQEVGATLTDATMAMACGVVDIGCGKTLDCGSCQMSPAFPEQGCGLGYPSEMSNPNDPRPPGTPHLCGGGCTKQTSNNGACLGWPGSYRWICTSKTVDSPMSIPSPKPCGPAYAMPGVATNDWCCY